ncbi:MAG: hypothetical protein WC378_07920 [Opitutaceae bacterium]|jgi:hypothetical protein
MFTSPKSKRTALWWGDRWWLAGRSVPFADAAHAANALAAAWPDEPRQVRIVYEPDGSATFAAPCPNGNRALLAFALADQHPALETPGIAWSFEPILSSAEGFSTLLHLEPRPALHEVVRQLREAGFTVSGAWPLPSWLNTLPNDLSESGAVCIAAVSPEHACVYRHAQTGIRSVERWSGPPAPAEFAAYLLGLFSVDATESVLLVTTEAAVIESIGAVCPLEDRLGLEVLTIEEALARDTAFGTRHPAQLLPPMPVITASRAVAAASVALLLTAAGMAGLYAHDYMRWRSDTLARETQKQYLGSELAHLRTNAAEIAALRGELAAVGQGPSASALLERIAATVPPEILLRSLKVTQQGFDATGWIAPAAIATGWDGWRSRLAAGLTLRLTPGQPANDGAWELKGESP